MDSDLEAASASAVRQLRLMMCGSWALSLSDMQRWEQITGQRPLERYGMTEFGMAISNLLDGSRRKCTVGTPFPVVHVKILAGDLCVKSPSLFKEYWKLPKVTEDSFTEDGYFKTGDAAKVDEDGNYVRGYKFSALEIEAILLEILATTLTQGRTLNAQHLNTNPKG
ncbi:malonate--CoA ligase [Tanacetum coccineum]